MLAELQLRNFRSVLKDSIQLPESGLAVLIGANGSGKTNVVRALEFIASLHQSDLFAAIGSHGGRLSIVPKAIPKSEIRGSRTKVSYTVRLPAGSEYPEGLANPNAKHELEIEWQTSDEFEVIGEHVIFTNPLGMALDQLMRTRDSSADIPETTMRAGSEESTILFSRQETGALTVNPSPPFREDNVPLYLRWLGLHKFEGTGIEISTGQDLRRIFSSIGRERLEEKGRLLEPRQSVLELGYLTPYFWSSAADQFKHAGQEIKRFDLRIAELRNEQRIRKASDLTSEGKNLPAVVRLLRRGGARLESWQRIRATLRDMAPYVRDVENRTLETGREYVQFREWLEGRPVQSWDQSDGTLRALAILVAVETHPQTGTVIIEEPEQGLHPWAVNTLIQHIRSVIEEREIRVILTSHSEQVIEAVKPHEVFVTQRTPKEGTTLRNASELVDLESPTSKSLGKLWVKGLMGGVPEYNLDEE